MPDSSRLQAERVVAGRYRLLRPIARGGMAEVWEAQDEILGRPVAVKVLHPHLAIDESFLERFRREAVSAARLAHPNVVATYDTGIDDGLAYIVMELVNGRTLRQALSEHGALSPSRATAIAAQVADALDYAHQAGVVHRDVKPANILLCPDGRVKVADFGIAKAAAALDGDGEGSGGGDGASRPKLMDELTRSGAIVGTAKYLSPEQINGEPVDGRADVYGLGVVLYEMVCGRPPFDGETDVAVAVQHVSATPLSPRQVRAGIPRSLEQVVLRALAKSPDQRYRSARELHSALLSVDVGPDDAVPIVVREITPPGGTPPTFVQSESRSLMPVAVIVLLAVAVGIIGVLFASSEPGKRLLNGEGDDANTAPVTVGRAVAFDPPPGSGHEHDEALSFLFDGDESTAWDTETYENASFGGLKPGVGFVLELDGAQQLERLELSTPTPGWDVEVCLADEVLPTRAEWGGPVAESEGVSRSPGFELDGQRAGAVLVWITNLGEANRSVSISEVRLGAPA